MATLGINFDSNEVEPSKGFDGAPIPAGNYIALVSDSDVKTTAAGTGTYANLCFDILEGEHAGRKVWQNLTLTNPSQQAEDIGRSQLSALAHAVGKHGQINDTVELHDIALSISVKIEAGKGSYGPSNKVTKYEALEGAAPAAPAQASRPAAQAQSASRPWERKKSA